MIIVCPKCSTRLQVDQEKSPNRPFNVRCPKCNATISSGSPSPALDQSALGIGGSPSTDHPRFEQPTARAYAPDANVFEPEYLSEKLETKAGWSYPSPDEDWMEGYPQELQDFAAAIARGRPPKSSAHLGRDVLEVIYAAYVSVEEGRRIELR